MCVFCPVFLIETALAQDFLQKHLFLAWDFLQKWPFLAWDFLRYGLRLVFFAKTAAFRLVFLTKNGEFPIFLLSALPFFAFAPCIFDKTCQNFSSWIFAPCTFLRLRLVFLTKMYYFRVVFFTRPPYNGGSKRCLITI